MKNTFEIVNLKCGGCANSIKKGLTKIDGVNQVEVDLDASKVTVDVNNAATLTQVKDKLATMGYPEVGDANTVIHKAKSFVSCASGRMSSAE
ncbi:MAG TPA: heavy metal-associated domain-containing protein [Flavobacteriaceae bacterium]|nr:heavy metal-associated domain-containing protein [Flavobacteriaceae bacterium]